MHGIRFHERISDLPAAAWDRLAATANPFVRHGFLAALERHRCIRPEWGWQPHHLALWRDGLPVAVAPLYLKGNSRGEFVFDQGWAHAWERAGGRYYPKLLNAVPWSPVTGPRLLAGTGPEAPALRAALVAAMRGEAARLGLATVHANFLTPADAAAFGPDWLERGDIQFHWHNEGYADFAAFLARLRHRKRKNIRQERRQAAATGLDISMVDAAALELADWRAVHALYRDTFSRKGNFGVLSRDFFLDLAADPASGLRVALARDGRRIVAMALFLEGGDTLYGRYWGSSEHHDGLHFELCYYRGIEHCIRRQLQRFEPGAQGLHKMARGFEPVRTRSRHHIAPAVLHRAVARALEDEAAALDAWERDLRGHSAYACAEPAPATAEHG